VKTRPALRLHWGCGRHAQPGWINSDRNPWPGVDVPADLTLGLPFAGDTFDYVVSVHALQEIVYDDILPALVDLRRVLRPGGVLRLVLPDLDRGIEAYLAGNRDHFLVPDEDAASLGGKLIVHMLWYGHSRLLFTWDFIVELLRKAGYRDVARCAFGETKSPHAEIAALDSRERESLFVEAVK
jgi:predicted SAM-dependent methyltransferase